MSWKRFTIFIVSLLCIAGGVKLVLACSFGPDPYDASSFFLNTINKQPAFVQFYYTPDLTFYTDEYGLNDTDIDHHIPDPNIAAWKKYTAGEISDADIDSFVYKFSATDVLAIYNHVQKSYSLSVPPQVAQNGFTKWLVKHKDAETALYLAFAKQCEPHTVPLESYWDNKTSNYIIPKRDSGAMQELVHEGIKQYNAAKNSEIKLRYAYQCIRMAFYSREYPQTMMLFDTMTRQHAEDFIYYRSLALKAGALYKTGKKNEAAYLYSLAFDKSDEIKQTAYQSFRNAVNGDISKVLPLCKNDHERAVLYIMQGLYDYGNDTYPVTTILENAYRLDPNVKGLDIVMTRTINKTELEVIPRMGATGKANNTQLAGLNTLAQKIAAEGKNNDKAYWLLTSAYIYLLTGDMPNCKQYLDKAKANKMSPNEQDVHYLVSTLYLARRNGKITASTEQELLPQLKELEARATKEHRYTTVFTDLMLAVLKNAYLQQGDTIRAIYCYSKSNSYNAANANYQYSSPDYTDDAGRLLEAMSPERLHTVQAFILKKDKSAYEAWLSDHTAYSTEALYELEGTKYIRMQQFDKAVAILKKVPDATLNKTELPDVLVSHIMDSQELNSSDKLTKYNKLTFAQKMLDLQTALKQDTASGRIAYQYANGLYNMSYYGKAHHTYDYYRPGYDEYAYFNFKERSKLQPYELEYYNVQLPEKYYMRAFEHTTDKEMKARCLFMAAKCRQKSCPTGKDASAYSPDEKGYYKYSLASPYFRRLKQDYGNTAFYKQATGSCAYLRDYARAGK